MAQVGVTAGIGDLLQGLTRVLQQPARQAWPYLFAQGIALFCLNFRCFYYAALYIPSGQEAVVFSTAPLWIALTGRLFLGRPIRRRATCGRCCTWPFPAR